MIAGTLGRLKTFTGGTVPLPSVAVASAGTIKVSPNDTVILLTSTAAVSTATTLVFNADGIRPGRRLTLICTNATDAITLKHTGFATAANGYFTAGGDVVLGPYDAITVMQLNNGSWLAITGDTTAA